MSEVEKHIQQPIECHDIVSATKQLNKILYTEHQQELLRRRLLFAQGGEELVKASRPFDITDDCNSDPLCHCFRGVALSIQDQENKKFKVYEKPVELKSQKVSYHVFFSNGEKIIDPTFGQFLRIQNIVPEKFRKMHPDLFVNDVFVGSLIDAQNLGIRYNLN